jgi:hypothetical protein
VGGVARSLLLGLTLALAIALPASASTWSGPSVVSPANTTTYPSPSVAINDAGVGIEAASTFDNASGAVTIRTATHTPGGAWVTDPAPASGAQIEACTPHASLDAAGNALVVWASWTSAGCSGTQTIFFATRAAGTTAWSAPVALGTGLGDDGSAMSAASNAAGQTVVGWETKNATNRFVTGASGSPTGGFGTPVTLTTVPLADLLQHLSTSVGAAGDAAVQWTIDESGVTNIKLAVQPHGGAFQPNNPSSITTNSNSMSAATFNSVAVDPSGNALSAYYFSDNGNPPVFASVLTPAGGAPQTQQVVGTPQPGFVASTIDLGFDGGGTATAAWVETNVGSTAPNYVSRVFSAVRAPGAASPWMGNAPLTGPAPSPEVNVRIAVAASGAAVVSWDAAGAENDEIAIYRPAGGAFGAAVNLGQGSASPLNGAAITAPSAAIAPGGDALVGFAGSVARDARVAVLDAHAPTITAMTVPASAAAAQSVAMTMSATDLWSGLATGQPVWSFGDGTSAPGSSVAHAYAKGGTYTVSLAATDGAGNASAPMTRQIVVAAPAGPATPKTTVAKPKLKAAYVASRLVGTIALSGTSAAPTSLSIAIRRSGAKKVAATVKLAVKKAGTWSKTIKLPASLLPGKYGVTVSGTGVTSSATSFTIAVPKTGVASRVYASGPRHGPAVTKLGRTSELWAHFRFGSLPKKGQAITTQWILPSGTKLGANARPRAALVEAQVKDLKGKPLPTGRWRCVLRVGGVVVATLNVRLT